MREIIKSGKSRWREILERCICMIMRIVMEAVLLFLLIKVTPWVDLNSIQLRSKTVSSSRYIPLRAVVGEVRLLFRNL